ncbi:MAG: family 16 glycosylhydrolase [Bacteroidota bacterium]|jgi:beta-glucanase (GH16 family)|nr:glycoside hydrolase family 16 protein [Flammeovirgaceae bacterium]
MEKKNQSRDRRMKLFGKSFFLFSVLAIFLSCQSDQQKVVNFTQLVMQDEFNVDGQPNANLWGYNIGRGQNGWGNNELQFYTDRAKNVTVKDGNLVITADRESFSGAQYTSARLLTKGKFDQTYGRFEARMQLPWGQGIWPAFWMLGADIDTNAWPNCGEIDIMELRGQNPTVLIGSIHGPGYSGGQAISKSYTLKNDRFDTGFHIFGVEWGPGYINFYVDNVLYNQIKPSDLPGPWVFNKPFFIIMNIAVGGNFVGSPNDQTVFPQTMLVDYVRVYKAE